MCDFVAIFLIQVKISKENAVIGAIFAVNNLNFIKTAVQSTNLKVGLLYS